MADLSSFAPYMRRVLKPPTLGDQYWTVFAWRRSKLEVGAPLPPWPNPLPMIPLMPAIVLFANGSMTKFVPYLKGVIHLPRITVPPGVIMPNAGIACCECGTRRIDGKGRLELEQGLDAAAQVLRSLEAEDGQIVRDATGGRNATACPFASTVSTFAFTKP